MSNVVLRITDGSGTVVIADDTGTAIMRLNQAGINLEPLQPLEGRQESIPGAGESVMGMEYDTRKISLNVAVLGTALSSMLANVRTVESILELSSRRWNQRIYNGTSTLVQLQAQLGTSSTANILFDVVKGEIKYPDNIMDQPFTERLFRMGINAKPAVVTLWMRPWGYTTSTVGTTGSAMNQGGTNFFDFNSVPGDGAAKQQLKIAFGTASGTSTVWIGRISGARQTSTLFREGESVNSTVITTVATAGGSGTILSTAVANVSNGSVSEFIRYSTSAADLQLVMVPNTLYSTWTYAIPTPTRGLFRALAYVRVVKYDNAGTGITTGTVRLGVGYSYGSVVSTPGTIGSLTGTMIVTAGSGTAVAKVVDMGEVRLLPSREPFGVAAGTYSLIVVMGLGSGSFGTVNSTVTGAPNGTSNGWHIGIDWVQLLPVDEGAVILLHPAGSSILLDTYAEQPGAYITNAAGTVVDIPDRSGGAFDAGPENTRTYIVYDGGPNVTFTATANIQPRYRGL